MENKDMGMGFFGRGRFGFDARENMREQWQKMSMEEKIEMMDNKVKAMKHMEKYMKGFFGRKGADFEEKSKKWEGMSYEQKVAFINEKEEAMKNGKFSREHFSDRKGFTVEAMDKFCEEWLKKTPEEKTESMKQREDMFHHRECGMGHFFGHRGFGFGAESSK